MEKKAHPKPTPDSLARSALYYLSRYAASAASLRRVLQNRVRKAAMRDPVFAADGAVQAALRDAIEKIVETHSRSGVINDAAFAAMKRDSLRRAGRSQRAIHEKLRQKGIAPGLVAEAFETEPDEQDGEAELKAARLFAKKRGFLGKDLPLDKKRKALASFARAGFSMAVASRCLGVQAPEEEGEADF